MYCTVCMNNNRNRKTNNISYFCYPKDPTKREKWLKAVGREDLILKIGDGKSIERYRICEEHFELSCIKYSKNRNRKYLFDNAFPTLNLPKNNDAVEGADDVSMYCDEDQNNQELPTKDGDTIFDHLRCSVCNGTISEFRYTCVQCSEFDLCGACEADRAHHHHYVLRVPAPRPFAEVQFVLATIRQHLMKKLDPITAGAAQEFEDGSVMPEVKLEVEYEENENNGDVEDNGDDNDNSDNENDNSDSEDDGDDSDSDNDNDSDNIVDSNKRDGEPEQEKKYDGRLKTSDVPAPLTDDFNTQKSVDISIKMEPMSDSPEHEVSTDQVSTLPTPSTAKRLITIKRPDTINMDEGASAAKKICVEPVSNTLRGSREKLIRVTASKTQEPCHDDPEIGQDCMEMPK